MNKHDCPVCGQTTIREGRCYECVDKAVRKVVKPTNRPGAYSKLKPLEESTDGDMDQHVQRQGGHGNRTHGDN